VVNNSSRSLLFATGILAFVFCGCEQRNQWVTAPGGVEFDKYLAMYKSGDYLDSPSAIKILDRAIPFKAVASEYGNVWGFAELPEEFAHLIVIPSNNAGNNVHILEIPKEKQTGRLVFVYFEDKGSAKETDTIEMAK
jgi:hypothetical protein